MAEQPKNILIIKPSSLGDIVLALPALTALRRSFPEAKITWLVRPEFADLLRGNPDLNEIILFDRRLLGKSWYKPKAFAEFMRLLRRLRRERFDLVFDFQGLLRTGFLTWVTGCKRRFGMSGAREFATLFYTHKLAQDYSCVHLVDYYLRMVAAAGANQGGVEFKLPEDVQADESVKKLLMERKVNFGNYVVIVPGTARTEKCWPIWNFSDIADEIAEKFGSTIVATGTQSERVLIEVLEDLTNARVVNLAGQTTLRELTALLKHAALVVSNDTGPGHIAAGLGVPMVMIFGPTNPARLRPYGRGECLVAVEPEAMGMAIESFDPKYEIGQITVEQVWERVCGQMEKSKKGS